MNPSNEQLDSQSPKTWEDAFKRMHGMVERMAFVFTAAAVICAIVAFNAATSTDSTLFLWASIAFVMAAASQWSIWFDGRKTRPKAK